MKTHVLVGFANPYIFCSECGNKVRYWHDPVRCPCGEEVFNHPCSHKGTFFLCTNWNPSLGCTCEDKKHE